MAVLVNKATRVICQGFTGPRVPLGVMASGSLRGLRTIALVAGTLALAACQPTTTPATASAPAIKVSANAGPGANPISTARARSVFASLCVATGGSLSATEAAAAADGFIRHASFGTYYHPRDNLSVKLIEGDCSMVFASAASAAELQEALTSLTTSPAVRFSPSVSLDGKPYYNARIAVR